VGASSPLDALVVGLPSPNPARRHTRLAVTAPPDASVTAEIYDALGRHVRTHALPSSAPTLDLDTASLAAGLYLIRVVATVSDHAAQSLTRPLTVVR
jgi:hypothetical protein